MLVVLQNFGYKYKNVHLFVVEEGDPLVFFGGRCG
jgi:hypothetical protein